MSEPIVPVVFQDLGLMPYKQAWDYQQVIFDGTVADKLWNRKAEPEQQRPIRHYLLFCEHPHVYTLGKSGDDNHLLANEQMLKRINAEYFHINRGGDITYHGPGQIVGYPILDLDFFFTDIHRYLRYLEEVIILTIAEYGLQGERSPGETGVWLDVGKANARKICAMGIKASRWVTMHGWAFNVNTDMNYFNYIVPCGITDKAVTSLEKELGGTMDMEEVKSKVRRNFEQIFGAKLVVG
jgi:lipoyl(octanoyl) transferase